MLVSAWRIVMEVVLGVEEAVAAVVEVLSWMVGERSHSAATGSSRHRGAFLLFFFVAL